MEFTLTIYQELLSTLKYSGYTFQTLAQFMANPLQKVVILRHDVDRLPENALKMAKLEHEMGVEATYYFRAVPVSWDEGIMREIAGMGHEVGYHYENLTMFKGDMEKALADFKSNLARMRELVPVSTVCMHGSPLSRIDNLELLKSFDYKGLGLVAEPYLDVDYNQVFYITDTGRKWNNESSSVRDRVKSGFNIEVKNTKHLIELARVKRTEDRGRKTEDGRQGAERGTNENKIELPDKIMVNVHPQRWHDRPLPWVKELVGQNVKNVVKHAIVKLRN